METLDRFWHGRSVLVTGSTGFLGSWLTQALVERRARVVGLVRDRVPDSLLLRSGTFDRIAVVYGSVEQAEVLERAIGDYEVDTVFHLAAQAIVGVALHNPVATFETNIRGTWNLLEACRRNGGPTRIVAASSDKAYGIHEQLPYHEELPLQGQHPYDVSKSCADMITTAYHRTWGSPVAITRCGNLYGGGDLNWNRIVPGTIRAALENRTPVIRSDGTPLRDYIHVGDVVRGYLALAEAMDDSSHHGEAYNFGVDAPLSALEMMRKILELAGCAKIEPDVLGQARAEIPSQYLSSAKAARELGWKAETPLDAGLTETIAWYREFLK